MQKEILAQSGSRRYGYFCLPSWNYSHQKHHQSAGLKPQLWQHKRLALQEVVFDQMQQELPRRRSIQDLRMATLASHDLAPCCLSDTAGFGGRPCKKRCPGPGQCLRSALCPVAAASRYTTRSSLFLPRANSSAVKLMEDSQWRAVGLALTGVAALFGRFCF